ncbi:hypothetical protein [Streptomyces canus]|uniref:hypothetical protein n=1 Tax=Streptomyces canus TaxID=58343 RepID=UPI002786816D|nr:hypothetical protein [Streptomyces canus]MDQ0758776.1 hypothetical protein [Streptomyces canus]
MTVPATAPEPGSAAAQTLGALSKLIQDANDGGLSYQDMAERAVDPDTGTRYYKQNLQKLVRNPPVNPPTLPQMKALANALSKPLRIIQAAVARQWLQFEATELSGYDEDTRIIVAHLAGQTPADKRRWRRMIEADERARREVDE